MAVSYLLGYILEDMCSRHKLTVCSRNGLSVPIPAFATLYVPKILASKTKEASKSTAYHPSSLPPNASTAAANEGSRDSCCEMSHLLRMGILVSDNFNNTPGCRGCTRPYSKYLYILEIMTSLVLFRY